MINSISLCLYASSLSVELIDIDTGASGAAEIGFGDFGSATETSPWVLADQYLNIEFDCDYDLGYWGLKIITDNPNDIIVDSNGDGIAEDGPVGVDDGAGNMFYGGIIKVTLDTFGNISAVTDDPAYRINICWQVYDEDDIATLTAVTVPAASDTDGDGVYTDDNVSTVWYTGEWAYIGDRGDSGYAGDAVLWVDNEYYVLNYNAIAYGAGRILRSLTPHPDITDRGITDDDLIDEDGDGDVYDDGWDIYVFIAGRFWNTGYYDYDGDGIYTASYFQMPAGEYRTNMYLELFYE